MLTTLEIAALRNLQNSDIPILLDMHIKSGLEYEFPDLRSAHMEAVKVVVDENGVPLMAAAAERILQAYLFCGEFEHGDIATWVYAPPSSSPQIDPLGPTGPTHQGPGVALLNSSRSSVMGVIGHDLLDVKGR